MAVNGVNYIYIYIFCDRAQHVVRTGDSCDESGI